jgi:hypothetical protein
MAKIEPYSLSYDFEFLLSTSLEKNILSIPSNEQHSFAKYILLEINSLSDLKQMEPANIWDSEKDSSNMLRILSEQSIQLSTK